MTTTKPKQLAKRRRNERGVALIIAVISITLLTVVATEFAYNQRVDLQIAANHRDDIRAYYLARSGIGLSRLVLRFQRQLDRTLGSLPPGIGEALGMPPGGGAGSLNIQLWKMAKVDCHLLSGMTNRGGGEGDDQRAGGAKSKFGFDDEFPELANKQATRDFGGFEGCFDSRITDEEERININRLTAGGLSARPVAQALYDLMNDKRFEFLFNRDDANRVRTTPADLLIALRDWADEDEVQSALNLTPNSPDPFVAGFSDEDGDYGRYDPRYKAKNARFDTIDELYRVHGVNDRFMAAFRDRITVYPDINSKPNINTDDPVLLYSAILAVADPIRRDPRLSDPIFVDELIQRIRTARMFAFFGMSVKDFISIIQAAGVAVNPAIVANVAANNYVGDKSNTYRIVSVGEAGAVQKTITTVIRLDDALGRLVYWREE